MRTQTHTTKECTRRTTCPALRTLKQHRTCVGAARDRVLLRRACLPETGFRMAGGPEEGDRRKPRFVSADPLT